MMEYSSLVDDILSPESTVTSLLSSSGRLRSSLLPPERNTSFRYRDKDYYSASAALDAYIADFERGCESSRLLLHSPPSTPSRPRVSTLRNKDVLRESLTERELDFLNLPVSSLHHKGNRDRLSMTTDELLSIPYDGSMPVTHTSAFIQGLLSHHSSSSSGHRACAGLSSSHASPRLTHHHHPHLITTPRSSRFSKSAHRAAGSQWAEPSSSHHLPRWLTGNKVDMDCSGLSDVPDLKYPAWIRQCERSELPPPPESELWSGRAPRTGAPSWVAELEDDGTDQTGSQVDSRQSLRRLTLEFAEQISLLAAERTNPDIVNSLFRDNRIESLIQKADQVLNSLSQSCEGPDIPAGPVSPAKTEELLLSPFLLPDSAAAAAAAAGGGSTESPADRASQTNDAWKQPGPVEALKQMLFRLQAVEAKLQRQEEEASAATLADGLQAEETPAKQRPEREAEVESFSGGPSLQRALHHLSRLKLLVEEPRGKHGEEEEEEEKEEDEGRYSSSSADRLDCTHQKPGYGHGSGAAPLWMDVLEEKESGGRGHETENTLSVKDKC